MAFGIGHQLIISLENHLKLSFSLCFFYFFLFLQISRWGKVEWAHDLELMETRSRVAAAALFYSLNNKPLSTSSV